MDNLARAVKIAKELQYRQETNQMEKNKSKVSSKSFPSSIRRHKSNISL